MNLEILKTQEVFLLTKVLDSPTVFCLTMANTHGVSRNSYILISDNDVMVVDPPLYSLSGWNALKEAFKELGVEGSFLKVFYTHYHADHFKYNLSSLPKGTQVFLSGYEPDKEGMENILAYQNLRFRKEGYPKQLLKAWNGPRGEAEISERLSKADKESDGSIQIINVFDDSHIRVGEWEFTCIHTPGHTIGHLCLGLKNMNLLFSGDTVLFNDLPYVGLWKGRKCALDDLMESLERLAKENYHMILPSHGNYEVNGNKHIEEIMNRYYFRILEMYRLVYDHPEKNAYQLSQFFCRCSEVWSDTSPKKQWHAMGETLSYLIYLRERKYVCSSRGENGMINTPGKRKITDS